MANYTINYACGHGSTNKNLVGKISERERHIAWAEKNMVCPQCYKAQKEAEDAAAEKIATITLVTASKPVISIEIKGQIKANADALHALGYRWSDSTSGGLAGYMTIKKPGRVLALAHEVASVDDMTGWIVSQTNVLNRIGYTVVSDLSDLDRNYLAHLTAQAGEKEAAREYLKVIQASDPKPEISPLRKRIAQIEKQTGQKWNGKIYGKSGGYNFYVANQKFLASDEEVSEREAINKKIDDWEEKYKDEIAAAR